MEVCISGAYREVKLSTAVDWEMFVSLFFRITNFPAFIFRQLALVAKI